LRTRLAQIERVDPGVAARRRRLCRHLLRSATINQNLIPPAGFLMVTGRVAGRQSLRRRVARDCALALATAA
jgi:hypothetical protein